MTRKVNQAGVDLIKKWEGWRSTAYYCSAKVLTIGYGHTSMAGPPKVHKGMKITKAQGEEILKRDLGKYEAAVVSACGRDARYTDNQFAAMVSLCYNIGPGNFKKSSVARYMRNNQPEVAATRFAPWNKAAGKVLKGLVRRRADETRLFKTKDGGRVPPPPAEVATGAGGVVATVPVATKAVQDGLVSPELAVAGVIVLAALVGLILFKRSKKT